MTLKLELLQRTGSFKARGAFAKLHVALRRGARGGRRRRQRRQLRHSGTWQEAIPPLLLFLGAYLVRFTSIWLSKIISGRYAEQTSTSLQSELMRKLLELGPRYAASRGSGQLITLLIDGVIRFRTYLELFVPRMIDMVFVTLPILITVYVLDFISGLILTFTLPVLIAFFILLGYAARRFADRQYKSYQVLARHFTDVLRGLETLRLLGRSRDFAGSVQQVSDRFRRATMRTLRVAFPLPSRWISSAPYPSPSSPLAWVFDSSTGISTCCRHLPFSCWRQTTISRCATSAPIIMLPWTARRLGKQSGRFSKRTNP